MAVLTSAAVKMDATAVAGFYTESNLAGNQTPSTFHMKMSKFSCAARKRRVSLHGGQVEYYYGETQRIRGGFGSEEDRQTAVPVLVTH